MAGKEEELRSKIHKLVLEKFDGDYRKGFDHYGKIDGQDSEIGSSALEKLLTDADVGNWLTRGLWVEGVLSSLGKNKDGVISRDEFESILNNTPQTESEQAGGPEVSSSTDT